MDYIQFTNLKKGDVIQNNNKIYEIKSAYDYYNESFTVNELDKNYVKVSETKLDCKQIKDCNIIGCMFYKKY